MDEDETTLERFALQTAFESACLKGRREIITMMAEEVDGLLIHHALLR